MEAAKAQDADLQGPRVSTGTAALYGLPAVAFAVAQVPITIFVPDLYASVLGVPLPAVGLILFLTRLSDVLTDPLVGAWSDRTRGRWGRRKPWILAGLPLLALCVFVLYAPPAGVDPVEAAWRLGLGAAGLYLAFTLIDIPWKSWGAELSTDYHQRSKVTGWREALGVLGTLVALLLVGLAGAGDVRAGLVATATFAAIGVPLCFAFALWRVAEPPPDGYARAERQTWAQGLRIVARNGPFLRLAVCSIALVTATAVGTTLNLFYVRHVIGAPEAGPLVLLGSLVASIVFAPVWVLVSRRIGKHRAVAIAAALAACLSLPLGLLGKGDLPAFAALTIAGGTASAAIAILVNSMAADVIDLDVARTGKARAGLYFAIWGMAIKLAVAIAVLLATAVPAAFGFDPAAAQPAGTRALAWTYALAPALLVGLAAPALWSYPVTEARQARMRAMIARRQAGRGGPDREGSISG
jgi:Na+/melibiose symporter-like transporter